jgi:hypothetical protein
MVGGIPASENIASSMMNAHHGERVFRPLRSSRVSASKPLRESRRIMPKETRLVIT